MSLDAIKAFENHSQDDTVEQTQILSQEMLADLVSGIIFFSMKKIPHSKSCDGWITSG
jgi:hypothetical protein